MRGGTIKLGTSFSLPRPAASTGEYFTKKVYLLPETAPEAPIFCQPNFGGNFDKNINFNANCIEDDMVRRNWQNI